MIIFITWLGHHRTLESIPRGTFGFPAPEFRITSYQRLFRARRFPRATYIFSDLDRLHPFELLIAADLYNALSAEGAKCLNNPAKVKSRLSLLRALHRAGVNPFMAYAAQDAPEPRRFPVFLRFESDHGRPLSGLIHSQAALDAALDRLETTGIPLRGVIVTEYCATPDSEGLFRKWGTFRIGDRLSVDHIAVEHNWLVKYGVWDDLTERAVREEHEAVKNNSFAPDLKPAFETGCIEFGRADHAVVDGKTVVYEINTNPYLGPYVVDPNPLRAETQIIARSRFAEALAEIDCRTRGVVHIRPTELLKKCRNEWRLAFRLPKRP